MVSGSYHSISFETNKPFEKRDYQFRIGSDEVVQVLNRGVQGMRVGDIRRLTIPPSCRVGGKEPWTIPPGQINIILEVTLTDVKYPKCIRSESSLEPVASPP